MHEILMIPLLSGLLIASIAGPLGSFIIWRKMAYFGDTLAHGSLFGLALGYLYEVNLNIALLTTSLFLALILVIIEKKSRISTDTVLGIIAHSSLAFGLVTISFLDDLRIDLMAYLFGDLLAVNQTDLIWIASGVVGIFLLFLKLWKPLLAISINEEMARIDGYSVEAYKLALMLLIAVIVALGMKFVGALIITSLMIIPAATAKRFARTPEQMAVCASVIGMISVITGIGLSWVEDTPAGPSIVVCAAMLFLLAQCKKQHR